VGRKYLVYAARNVKGQFGTSICSTTEEYRANDPERLNRVRKWIFAIGREKNGHD